MRTLAAGADAVALHARQLRVAQVCRNGQGRQCLGVRLCRDCMLVASPANRELSLGPRGPEATHRIALFDVR